MQRSTGSSVTVISTGLALILTLVVGYATRQYLMPSASAEAAVTYIWWIALGLALVGIVITYREWRRLRRESKVLDRLNTPSFSEELDLIAKDTNDARSLVVFGHARLVSGAIKSGVAPSGDFKGDWRRISIERTASVGSAQRFLASALLLLAVLGTFSGLKSALPHLSSALTGEVEDGRGQVDVPPTTPQGRQGDGEGSGGTKEIASALALVSNAFGANFLALLSSLVLGAAGFGLAQDRRQLLSNLDEVATRTWYQFLPLNTGLSTLERAVEEMRGSAVEVGRVGDAIGSLNTRLENFQSTLVDALQTMVGDVRSTMHAQAITADARQESQMAALVHNLGLVTKALERTSVGYEGLVKGLQERDLGVATAASALEKSSVQATETERILAEAVGSLAAMRKEWESHDRAVRKELREFLLLLQGVSKSVEGSVVAQESTLARAIAEFSGFREEQKDGRAASLRQSTEENQIVTANGRRLEALKGTVDEMRSVETSWGGEIVEIRSMLQSRADAAMARWEKESESTRLDQQILAKYVTHMRDLIGEGLSKIAQAGHRQSESTEALLRQSIDASEKIVAQLESGRIQTLASLGEEFESVRSALSASHTTALSVRTNGDADADSALAAPTATRLMSEN